MISYLKGSPIEVIKNTNNRVILVLEVNEIGYELQIPSKLGREISQEKLDTIQIFTHVQIKEDQQILYGFSTTAERELFRQLISVSGIGAQSAIALIDTLGLEELVQAIVTGNIRILSQPSGIGRKTAERIALELRTKLSQWRKMVGVTVTSSAAMPSLEILEDIEMTLLALGYTNEEINKAISTLSQDNLMLKNTNTEEWIKEAIAWLSQGT
ncbi:Holliday junction DNA helicase [Crocosphaera subtropica ATCC 51142]|uniref:Holliday junction branch migration complex subunit RuvA n=1 Tax=Crocosphaera subtropica (strain ATCC 51142 / BH68) TaxID=43989 RepID=RUVA_CROS5|nr:Holliday junction branch migration protein RuvA [Crocosphaera subtropica]B1WUV7.1 RecName: Full=Holliday junction branch migration complex subunit RuvA [Crocosphaera subtropica ATCC 51142]ACB50558.1 Holliday junction DNA helicase [Crocosphaera subtropica ATCC 51142]